MSVLTSGLLGKIGVAGRLALLAVISGVLTAALVLPAVAIAGMAVRNSANKFNTLSTPELGQLPVRSEILDNQGKLLAYYYPHGIDRVPVAFAQIAPVMRTAIVAIEDSRFYQHGAIDFKGTVRALVNDLRAQAGAGRLHALPAVRQERADPVVCRSAEGGAQRRQRDDRQENP